MLVFLFYYPLSYIKRLRPVLSSSALIMSMVLNATIWIYAYVFIVNELGWWGVLSMLFLQLLYPVAIIGAVLKDSWMIAGNIAVGLLMAYVMKLFSLRFMAPRMNDRPGEGRKGGDIIDVEIVNKDSATDQDWRKISH